MKVRSKKFITSILLFSAASTVFISLIFAGNTAEIFQAEASTVTDSIVSYTVTDDPTSSEGYIEFNTKTDIPPIANESPVPVPECGALFGAYINPGSRDEANNAQGRLNALTKAESELGRKLDTDHAFYKWDDFIKDANIENYVNKLLEKSYTPFLSWKPVYSAEAGANKNLNISWASIKAGKHDDLIRAKALQAKKINGNVFLALDHEMNGRVGDFEPGDTVNADPQDGHVRKNAGSAEEFVAMWRHVHDIFREEGVKNVAWVWIVTPSAFNNGELKDQLYPGDEYVDWIGNDPYNFYTNEKNWVEISQQMAGFTAWVSSTKNTKPWIIGEWGTVNDNSDNTRKATWYTNAADYFESESRIKAIVYFDSTHDSTKSWFYSETAESLAAFKAIANRPYFKQAGCQ